MKNTVADTLSNHRSRTAASPKHATGLLALTAFTKVPWLAP